jgi:hypothetical protein
MISCSVSGNEWSVHSAYPAGQGRCPECRAAGRHPTAELAHLAAVMPALVVLAAVLWRLLP